MSDAPQKSFKLKIVRDVAFPLCDHAREENFEDALDVVSGDGDIIVASFPKTGSTWIQYIILQIKSKAQLFPSLNELNLQHSPYIGLAGRSAVHAQGKHKFYKVHVPYDKITKNPKSKYIYTYRHPEDTVVSAHNFWSRVNREHPEFNEFFEHFINGNVGYGNYFEHILSAYGHREDENLFMVSYEKLHANRKEEILRIAKFLNEEYYENLMQDSQLLSKILEHTSFDYMKNYLSAIPPDTKNNDQGVMSKNIAAEWNFFRKGIVGDGKSVLTEIQRQRLKEAAGKVLKDTSVMKEWYPETSN